MIEIILWVVAGILWTVVVSLLSYLGGIEMEKKRRIDEILEQPIPVPRQVLGLPHEVTKKDLDALNERIGLVDQQVQHLHSRTTPGEFSAGGLRRLEQIEPLMGRVKDLEDRDSAYQDRFKRVERKAGMNV